MERDETDETARRGGGVISTGIRPRRSLGAALGSEMTLLPPTDRSRRETGLSAVTIRCARIHFVLKNSDRECNSSRMMRTFSESSCVSSLRN